MPNHETQWCKSASTNVSVVTSNIGVASNQRVDLSDGELMMHLVGWRKGSHDVDVNMAETACWHGNVVYGGLCMSLHLACLALRACLIHPLMSVAILFHTNFCFTSLTVDRRDGCERLCIMSTTALQDIRGTRGRGRPVLVSHSRETSLLSTSSHCRLVTESR